MSKFDYGIFVGGADIMAVSKEKYTKEQAIELAKIEIAKEELIAFDFSSSHYFLAIGDGYVRHRAGINEDKEPCVGWWLEYEEYRRSVPCWVFHLTLNCEEWGFKNYEYIQLESCNCITEKKGEKW